MKAELLLPAGNKDSLMRAVMCGADAVYLGLQQFNARASAENFNTDNLNIYIKYCHLYNVKVYVAFNTAIKDSELLLAEQFIGIINESQADGIILTDIGLFPIINRIAPNLPIHISTQAGINNLYGAEFFNKLGADRFVLARESTEKDIKSIKENLNIDMEYFIQGALCVCYSGGCLMSSIENGGSGNRGGCLQPCRQKYTLKVNKNSKYGYMLSTSDLCLINKLNNLTELGIKSFKIEGRLRRPEYVAQAALSYRKVLDNLSKPENEIPYLKRAFNRGDYSEGYIYSDNDKIMSTDIQGHIGEFCGSVIRTFFRNNYMFAEVNSSIPLTQGDGLKILRNGMECGGADIHSVEDKGSGRYIIPVSREVMAGDNIYLTTDRSINDELNKITKKMGISLECRAQSGKPLFIKLIHGNVTAEYQSEFIVPNSLNAPTNKPEIINQLSKLTDTEFELININVECGENIFIPKSQLNDLRRCGIENLKNEILKAYVPVKRRNALHFSAHKAYQRKCEKKIIIELQNIYQLSNELNIAAAIIFNPENYSLADIEAFSTAAAKLNKSKLFLSLPKIIRFEDNSLLEEISKYLIDKNIGIYADNFGAVEFARAKKLPYIGGTGLNIYNKNALEILYDAEFIVASPELNEQDAIPLLNNGAALFTYGYLPLMTLGHCPVKLVSGGNCCKCNYSGEFTYTDNKYTFSAFRSKLKTCTFTIYNALPHNLSAKAGQTNYNLFINFRKHENCQCKEIISLLNKGETLLNQKGTTGNYTR